MRPPAAAKRRDDRKGAAREVPPRTVRIAEAPRARALARFTALAANSDLVGVDLFDTLIRRNFHRPEDLFHAMAAQMEAEDPDGAAFFAVHRQAAETEARRDAAARGAEEVTLDDIYAVLGRRAVRQGRRIDGAALMTRECEIERIAVTADADVRATFDGLVAAGHRIVLVSDMYLPRAVIEAMLARCGIAGHERLYLSGEIGRTKRTGSIWPHIRADLGLGARARIVHLGDNPVSDGAMARRHGIRPTLIRPDPEAPFIARFPRRGEAVADICRAVLHRSLAAHPAHDAYWQSIAHLVVAPAAIGMAGFVRRIAGAEAHPRRIAFLARDGLIFRKAYETAWRRDADPPSAYLWSSRRCLNLPAIEKLDETDLRFLTSGSEPLPARAYLARIGLDPDSPDIAPVFARFFANPYDRVGTPDAQDRLRAAFRALAAPLLDRARAERSALFAHLDTIGLFDGPSLVVDIGWHGSLQRSLIRLGRLATGGTIDLAGAYLGTTFPQRTTLDGDAIRAHGYLFENAPDPGRLFGIDFNGGWELLELFFAAPEPGIVGIDVSNGTPRPIRATIAPEEAPRLALAALFHEATETVAAAMRPVLADHHVEILRDAALDNFLRLLGRPLPIDARKVAALQHPEGFGTARYRPIVTPPPRLAHPGALYRGLRESFWRTGFIAGLDPATRTLITACRNLHRAMRRHA